MLDGASSPLPAGHEAAVDVEGLPGGEVGCGRGEVNGDADQVGRFARPAGRDAVEDPAALRLVGPERLSQLGLDPAGADAVDLDVLLGPFDRHHPRHLPHPALAQPLYADAAD